MLAQPPTSLETPKMCVMGFLHSLIAGTSERCRSTCSSLPAGLLIMPTTPFPVHPATWLLRIYLTKHFNNKTFWAIEQPGMQTMVLATDTESLAWHKALHTSNRTDLFTSCPFPSAA